MSKAILEYKIIPRGMMLAFTTMAWNVCDWFMSLGVSATTQQTAFVSTIVGAATGAFAVWMANESK
jgi:hypothetical protein